MIPRDRIRPRARPLHTPPAPSAAPPPVRLTPADVARADLLWRTYAPPALRDLLAAGPAPPRER